MKRQLQIVAVNSFQKADQKFGEVGPKRTSTRVKERGWVGLKANGKDRTLKGAQQQRRLRAHVRHRDCASWALNTVAQKGGGVVVFQRKKATCADT